MKTINTLFIALGLSGALFLYPCSEPAAADFEEEGIRAAQKFWAQRYTECGDSYYSVEMMGGKVLAIIEFKDVAMRIVPYPLREEDKLRGYEGRATTVLEARASRTYQPTGFTGQIEWHLWAMEWTRLANDQDASAFAGRMVWTQWVNGAIAYNRIILGFMRKIKGQWIVGASPGTDASYMRAMDCSQIPKD